MEIINTPRFILRPTLYIKLGSSSTIRQVHYTIIVIRCSFIKLILLRAIPRLFTPVTMNLFCQGRCQVVINSTKVYKFHMRYLYNY